MARYYGNGRRQFAYSRTYGVWECKNPGFWVSMEMPHMSLVKRGNMWVVYRGNTRVASGSFKNLADRYGYSSGARVW